MIIIPTEKRFDWKHAPVVLFILVILNTLIYFVYQFGDSEKVYKAVISYNQKGYFDKEWPIYQEYLKSSKEIIRLEQNNYLFENIKNPQTNFRLIYNIVRDLEFYQYLEANSFDLFELDYIETWALPRQIINEQLQSVSTISYGLTPSKINLVNLFSHQFMHGSVMHLLGNMFFLIICGFAVEAAIGHMKFLLFYLLSGLSGGLLFSFMDLTSTTPLVGASGAISGVMAMYLGVFRFKKIEFFYWFFVFVGYFRAPALLILPFYIGKELYDFFNDGGSNVAFMAHAGGFVVGSILMMVAYLINPKMMNDEYIEEDQDIPKLQVELSKVYDYISRFRFESALMSLETIIKNHGINFDWAVLKYNLFKIQQNKNSIKAMKTLLLMPNLKSHQLCKVESIWNENTASHNLFNDDELYKFAWNMSNSVNYNTAEDVFALLNGKQNRHRSLGLLARKLSVIFAKMNNLEKKQKYEQITHALH